MGDAHNIFISWSKPQAKASARALRDWLPRVVQASKPWMSETDIEKGRPWLVELMSALGGLKLGIVCLTPEGLSEPWVLFEVGVICRALDPETRIWTYLLGGLRPSDVPHPLGMFQHTLANKEDTFRLLASVNQAMGERGVSEEILKEQFEMKWDALDEKLRAVPVPSQPVHTSRSNEEMFREIVEAVRSGASDAKAMDEIREQLSRQQRIIGELAAENDELRRRRVPLSSLRVPVSEADKERLWNDYVALNEPSSARFRRLAEAMAGQKEGGQESTGEKEQGNKQAGEEQLKPEQRRIHAPAMRRAGRGKLGGGEKN